MAEGSLSAEIEELDIPTAPGAAGWGDFCRAVEIGNLVDAERFGTPDLAYEPAEELVQLQSVHKRERLWVARLDGELVGRSGLTSLADAPTSGWVNTFVLSEARGRGLEAALADRAEEAARATGLASVISYVAAAPVPEPGTGLASPTGFGAVPDDDSARFLRGRGYTLEQVERVSRIGLPVAGVAERLAAAEERSGPDYRLHAWVRRIPERWYADIAAIATQMGTDAPTAGLDEPEDPWTAERVAAEDERRARTSPRTTISAGVEHLPTGRLVGVTDLSVPQQSHRAVQQYATLVLREHRGHRLGMLLKLANLAHLEREFPGHPSVITFNAEENRPMLDVNERLGFEPIAVEGAWQKKF